MAMAKLTLSREEVARAIQEYLKKYYNIVHYDGQINHDHSATINFEIVKGKGIVQ